MENAKKAYGYLRVSSNGQVDGDGFPRQRAAITKWAAANGIEIVRWFEEKGVTGTIADRPALQQMMVALMSNGIRTFLIEKLDRLARDFMVQEYIVRDCQSKGIEIISVMEPDLCKDDPTRELFRTFMGGISQYDKKMIVAKLKAARQRKRLQTGRCEGRKPYGTRAGEQAAIVRIRELHASGLNYEAIARQLNADRIKTRMGRQWFPATIRRVLIAQ